MALPPPAPNTRPGPQSPLLGTRRAWIGLWLACAVAAATAAPPTPAEDNTAVLEHHVGKVSLVALNTPDLAASKSFYAGLFGWTYESSDAAGPRAALAVVDGRTVAVLYQERPGQHRHSAWTGFLAVRDVEAARVTAVRNGARVLKAPYELSDFGTAAVFADPQGATFAVIAASDGDPPDVLAQPGEWIWASLFTADPEADAGFYQTVFDYEVFDLPAKAGAQHLLFASDDQARASANTLPAGAATTHPHWLNYVRVVDVAQSTARAVGLGGKVLVAPRPDRHGGQVAVVSDAQGAAVGLLEWPASGGTAEQRP